MKGPKLILVPQELTVEQAKRHVSIDTIVIGVSSEIIREGSIERGIIRRVELKSVLVKKESEMTPELVMAGPKRRGEVNQYTGIDGRWHYFDAKTGEAIGSELRDIDSTKAVDPMPPLAGR
jgi:hypothetical protein